MASATKATWAVPQDLAGSIDHLVITVTGGTGDMTTSADLGAVLRIIQQRATTVLAYSPSALILYVGLENAGNHAWLVTADAGGAHTDSGSLANQIKGAMTGSSAVTVVRGNYKVA